MFPARTVPARKTRARALAEFLPAALDPLVAKLGMSQATLILNWGEIVGERLAAVCEPVRLRWPPRGPKSDPGRAGDPATLVLRVQPGFALEIQHLASTLADRANAHLGWRCIDRITIRQEPLTRRTPAQRTPFVVAPEAEARAAALAAGIEDEGLKNALTRLGAAALSERRR